MSKRPKDVEGKDCMGWKTEVEMGMKGVIKWQKYGKQMKKVEWSAVGAKGEGRRGDIRGRNA